VVEGDRRHRVGDHRRPDDHLTAIAHVLKLGEEVHDARANREEFG
jgi:hypothetical protein